MRFILCSLSAVFFTACTVQSKNPDFVYPELRASTSSDWPTLTPTQELIRLNEQAVGDVPSPERELAARIARLRAKAARLSAYRF